MEYEIVYVERKIVVGYLNRTANDAPDMGIKIGGLWQKLYDEGGIQAIQNRVGQSSMGLYTNYESDYKSMYDIIVGCEVNSSENIPEECVCVEIPAGKYARFSLLVDKLAEEVGQAWGAIWQMDLPRAYTVDFEEYPPAENEGKAPVYIYIALLEE